MTVLITGANYFYYMFSLIMFSTIEIIQSICIRLNPGDMELEYLPIWDNGNNFTVECILSIRVFIYKNINYVLNKNIYNIL